MIGFTSIALWMGCVSFVLGLFVCNNIHGKITWPAIFYIAFFFGFFIISYTGTVPPVVSLAIAIVAFIFYARHTRKVVKLENNVTWNQ